MSLITDDLRKQVYDDLADSVIDALDKGTITPDEGQKSAEFIIPKLDAITEWENVLPLLKELTSKWSIYESVYVQFQTAQTKTKETQFQQEDRQKLAQIQLKLKQLSKQ